MKQGKKLLAGLIIGISALLAPAAWADDDLAAASPADEPKAQLMAESLSIPLAGVLPEDLQDTFTDSRSRGRVHDAIDIMAPMGTPVHAATDGIVAKIARSRRGGLEIYQFSMDGAFSYYYAHLSRYTPELREGLQVKRGDVIGYVGASGNASTPHLHFAISQLDNAGNWWKGTAINPYPLLAGRESIPRTMQTGKRRAHAHAGRKHRAHIIRSRPEN